MHHSIQRGRTVHVPAQGSTNLGGGNGAGKTSTMKLIPIFWGLDPERTVVQAGGNKSFKEHYLPSSASMLIYHYTREDGPYMSVMYLHSRGLVYRFVKGQWQDTFATPSLKSLLREGKPVSELFEALQDLGVQVSSPIRTIIEYRAIIQNNKKLLRRGQRHDKKSTHMAQQYCVGHAGVSMQYMDDLCYALLYRKTIFSRLKEMICGTMFEDLHVSEKPEHFKNIQLIDNINSLRAFSVNEKLITNCLSNHLKYLNTETELNTYARNLISIIVTEEERQKTLDQEYENLITESLDTQEHYDNEIRNLKDKQLESEENIKQAKAHIDNIYTEKERWEARNIDEKINAFENLPSLKKRADNAEEHLRELKQDIIEPEMQRNDQRARATEIRDSEKKKLDEQCAKLRENIQHLKDDAENKKGIIAKDCERVLEEHRKEESQLSEIYSTELGRLEERAKHSRKSEEEQLEEAIVDESLQQAQEKEEQTKTHLSNLEEELRAMEAHREEASTTYDACRQAAKDIENELQQLTQQLYPQDNSLLAALKNSAQSWTENIGLIINPDLLSKTDLSPTFHEDVHQAAYGWELTLSHVDKPQFCESDAFLKAESEKKEILLRNANDDLDEANRRLKTLNHQHHDCSEQLTLAKHQFERAKSQREQAYSQRKAVLADIKSSVANRTREAKQELEKRICEFDVWKKEREERRKNTKEVYANEIIEVDSRLAIDTTDIKESIAIKIIAQEEIENEYRLQINTIEQQFSDECRKIGVPPETIAAARQQAERLRLEVKRASEHSDVITEYKSWVKVEWSKLAELGDRVATQTVYLDSIKRQINSLKQTYENQIRSLKSRQTENEGYRRKLSEQLHEAKIIRDKVGAVIPSANPVFESTSLPVITENVRELYSTKHKLRSELIENVDKVKSIVASHPASQVYQAWQRLVERRISICAYSEHDPAFKLQQPQDIETLWREQIPSIRQTLIETFRAVSDNLDKYYASLKKINHRVDVVSSELGAKIDSARNISAISDIEIILTSSITEDACWEPLSHFCKQWDNWCRVREKDQLPSADLMDLLTKALNSLSIAKINSDIRSLIELKIQLKQNNNPTTIRSDSDMEHSSSNGLSLMAMCIVFVGMSRYLCPNTEVTITWPIDELQCLEDENIVKLFEMFEEENIVLFSAFPREDHNILKWFTNRVFIDPNSGFKIFQPADNIDATEKRKALMGKLSALKEA